MLEFIVFSTHEVLSIKSNIGGLKDLGCQTFVFINQLPNYMYHVTNLYLRENENRECLQNILFQSLII